MKVKPPMAGAAYRRKYRLPPASKDLVFPGRQMSKGLSTAEYVKLFEQLNHLKGTG